MGDGPGMGQTVELETLVVYASENARNLLNLGGSVPTLILTHCQVKYVKQ